MRNNRLNGWQPGIQSRAEYIREIKDRNPFHNETIPAFAPSCAFEHMEKNEPIPRDLPHTLHTIYQIRCNLFHGGKDYSNKGDRVFIELAYSILWPLFREEFPIHFSQISWDKIFIFTGFLFEKNGDKFDLKKETPENLDYLTQILKNFDLENHLDRYCFTPPQEKFFFDDWTKLLSQIHSSSSLKPETQFNFNNLKSVDPCIAGFIRWVNYIGIKTNLKGYGPHNRFFIIGFDTNQDYSNFHFCISIVSNRQEKFTLQRGEIPNIPCFRIPNDPKKILSLSEKFFHNKEKLSEILKLSNSLKKI